VPFPEPLPCGPGSGVREDAGMTADLIERARTGDGEALASSLPHTGGSCRYICYRLAGSVHDASAASFGRPAAALPVHGAEPVSHAGHGSLQPGVFGADAARGVDEPADGGRLVVAPPERVEDDVSGR